MSANGGRPARLLTGTLASIPREPSFDAVLYIDVLEHIEDDQREVQSAVDRLRDGGALIILSPAHQSLFSEFDRRIGHFRRYDAHMYRQLTVAGTTLERVEYLDSVGTMLSWANRAVLRSEMPTLTQVQFWDRWVVPLSRALDPVFGWRLGKSVLGVWRKQSR